MEQRKHSVFFSRTIHRIQTGISRFAPVFVFSLLLLQSIIYSPTTPFLSLFPRTTLPFAAALAMIAAVNARLFCEKQNLSHKQIYPWVAAVGTFAVFWGVFYLIRRNAANNLSLLPTFLTCGLVLAGSAFAVWQLYGGENADSLFSHLFKNLLISGTACMITFIGISICGLAVESLLFSIPYQLLLELELCPFYLIFPNMICAQLPAPNEKTETPKAMHLLLGRVAFPIYLFLICILCGYVGKIVVTWKMPSGTMNWFASLALAGYLFFWLALRQDTALWVRKVLRWGWLALLPIFTVQMAGIIIRLHAYGLTPARYAGLLLLAVGMFGLILAALNKHPRSLFLAFAAAILIGSCTPLNIMDFPRYCQAKRLKNILSAHQLWDGETLEIQPVSLSLDEQEQLHSSIVYLNRNPDPLMWEPRLVTQIKNLTESDWAPLLDDMPLEHDPVHAAYSYHGETESIPVTGYDKICPLYWYGDTSSCDGPCQVQYNWNDGTHLDWNGEEYVLSLIQRYPQEGDLSAEDRMFPISDTQALYISWINISTTRNQIDALSFEGYLLEKTPAES